MGGQTEVSQGKYGGYIGKRPSGNGGLGYLQAVSGQGHDFAEMVLQIVLSKVEHDGFSDHLTVLT